MCAQPPFEDLQQTVIHNESHVVNLCFSPGHRCVGRLYDHILQCARTVDVCIAWVAHFADTPEVWWA